MAAPNLKPLSCKRFRDFYHEMFRYKEKLTISHGKHNGVNPLLDRELNEPHTMIFNFYVCFIFRYLVFRRHMNLKRPEAHIFSYVILVLNIDFEGM